MWRGVAAVLPPAEPGCPTTGLAHRQKWPSKSCLLRGCAPPQMCARAFTGLAPAGATCAASPSGTSGFPPFPKTAPQESKHCGHKHRTTAGPGRIIRPPGAWPETQLDGGWGGQDPAGYFRTHHHGPSLPIPPRPGVRSVSGLRRNPTRLGRHVQRARHHLGLAGCAPGTRCRCRRRTPRRSHCGRCTGPPASRTTCSRWSRRGRTPPGTRRPRRRSCSTATAAAPARGPPRSCRARSPR